MPKPRLNSRVGDVPKPAIAANSSSRRPRRLVPRRNVVVHVSGTVAIGDCRCGRDRLLDRLEEARDTPSRARRRIA